MFRKRSTPGPAKATRAELRHRRAMKLVEARAEHKDLARATDWLGVRSRPVVSDASGT